MKINWQYDSGQENNPESANRFAVDNLTVGFRQGEFYIRLGDAVILLSPQVMKKLLYDLEIFISVWEKEHGKIKSVDDRDKKKAESVPKRVLKSLYKSHKVSQRLISINTARKKSHPG